MTVNNRAIMPKDTEQGILDMEHSGGLNCILPFAISPDTGSTGAIAVKHQLRA